jgi:hypothetical protein
VEPALRAVRPDINVIRGHNQIIWQFGCAHRTENNFVHPKRNQNFRRPPARRAKIQAVAIRGIELRQNHLQSSRCEFKIRRQLKQEAARFPTQRIGDLIKFTAQGFCALKMRIVRDGAVDFDGVAKVFRSIAFPVLHGRRFWPALKRRVEFDGAELLRVICQRGVRRQIVRVKRAHPLAAKPAGGGNVIFHGGTLLHTLTLCPGNS